MANINNNSLNTTNTATQIGKIQNNNDEKKRTVPDTSLALGKIQSQKQLQNEAVTVNALDIQAIYAKAALLTSVKSVNAQPISEYNLFVLKMFAIIRKNINIARVSIF